MDKRYIASSFNDRRYIQHWKYAYKKKVNGKWRYYYDNSNKQKNDSGFSYKKNDRNTLKLNSSISVPGMKKDVGIQSKSYYVNGMEVDEDTYKHAGAKFYYKNEPIRDITQRQYESGKEYVKNALSKVKEVTSSTIDKGKKWLGID